MEECVFCRIIRKEQPAFLIEENDSVVVFMSLENHPLVVTKEHIQDIYALHEEAGCAVMKETIKVTKAVKDGLRCNGVYLTQCNEPAARQDVFHFHLHVFPCWEDGLEPHVSVAEDLRRERMEHIKAALSR
jgi:histidine triad (HIT) family protein